MATSWRRTAAALTSLYLSGFGLAQLSPVNGTVGDIHWEACGNGTLPGAECGYAIVPLDYQDASKGVAKIALGRFNATSGTRKGSVFVNPGGPGGTGVDLATQAGDALQSFVGEEFDIIGFDPRGIGQTEPAVKCYPSPEAREAFLANTVLDRSYDVSSNLTDPFNRYSLIQQQRDAIALFKTEFAICAQTMGELIGFMGTTLVARDIDFMTTLIDGKDALINYYGLSYGTVIGQYLVNLFPDRVGRVSIDGVVDADVWANVPPFKWFDGEWLSSTDDEYMLFFQDCAQAGPSKCALAKEEGEAASDIMARVEAFQNALYTEPLPGPNATVPTQLTYGRGRFFWIDVFVSPTSWPDAAQAVDQAMNGNTSAMLNAANEKEVIDLERSAVTCNDVPSFSPPTAEEYVDQFLFQLENKTRFVLAIDTHEPDSGCEYWPATPPERYTGPFNKTLSNPILIISNTHDPVTSLANGKTVNERMGNNSGLLIQDGPGHTSTALPSSCTVGYLKAFFANGTFPPAGTICPVDITSGFDEETSGLSAAAEVLVASGASNVRDNAKRLASFVLSRNRS